MKAATRKFHKRMLIILTVIFMIGVICAQIASKTYRASVTLTEGETASISAFRLLPGKAWLRLDVTLPENERSASHIFAPGAARVQVSTCKETTELVTRPLTAYDKQQLKLGLWTSSDFARSPPNGAKHLPKLAVGPCTLTVKILEVDPTLARERAVLFLEPPISFKRTEPGYLLVWIFAFGSPVFLVILILYFLMVAGFLAFGTRTQNAKETAQH